VAEDFLKAMISSVEEALLSGEVVKIKNFGTFKLQWNEPRKSVNVQTGEEILLSGYHKVVFTPDAILRDAVNEPFAHLTPVELESENPEPIQESTEVDLDPLRIFTDQATEIKDLINEIQALSPKIKPIPAKKDEVLPEESDEQDEVFVDKIREDQKVITDTSLEHENIAPLEDDFEPLHEKVVSEKSFDSIAPSETKKKNPEPEVLESIDSLIPEFESTPFLKDLESPKRQKAWLWVLIVVLLLWC
jgi:nucleoid DNA-binding protein